MVENSRGAFRTCCALLINCRRKNIGEPNLAIKNDNLHYYEGGGVEVIQVKSLQFYSYQIPKHSVQNSNHYGITERRK